MDESRPTLELGPESLRRVTVPAQLPFQTTATLAPPDMMVGQDRAREAIALALDAPDGRYNLYVSGAPGTGRTDATLAQTRAVASLRHPSSDWVYVYNFDAPEEPLALELAAGRGRPFAHDVDLYVVSFRRELRRAFSSDVYDQQSAALLSEPLANRDRLLESLSADARALGFELRGTPSGYMIVPLAPAQPGAALQPLTEEAFDALPDAEKKQIQVNHDKVESAIAKALPQVRAAEDEARGLVRTLDHQVAETAGRHLSDQLTATYASFPAVVEYLIRLHADIVAHARVLIAATDAQAAQSDGPSQDGPTQGASSIDATEADGLPKDDDLRASPALRSLLRRYGVNVLVAHAEGGTAPVVVETSPTYSNLTGRIDIGIRDGLPFTDHMMLKPGAMHKAVGGFLILQAYDVLTQPRSWEAVKRMVRFERIEIENTSQPIGNNPGATIRPRPIRADVKVILVGDPHTYAELAALDPEFRQNFKVRADFDYDMPRDTASEQAYAALAGQTARSIGSPDFTNDAVALVIEEGSRWVEDQERLSTQLADVQDLCVEAGYFAKRDNDTLTRRSHVEMAIQARERMRNMEAVRLQQDILRQAVMISTQGAAVGQINGLYVREILGYEFGMPARITATVSPGLAGVVTVDREADLSGPTHTKGVLVLAGYLAGHFAEDFPLSLSASLSFEQTYHGVDGDSASSAELYALLSALADLPIKQTLAVTGSVNQRGEVQAIGGATHKIEGFFHLCQQRGLTGEQGVIIPRINARNLMLREDVVEAVRAGKFHIYGVSTIEEGIQALTGIPFGTKTSDGRYLEGTVASRVLHRLRAYSTLVQRYSFGVRNESMRG
ncbi:MAG TPA: ATP-binding protein [Ktedonobacterales bacterium]